MTKSDLKRSTREGVFEQLGAQNEIFFHYFLKLIFKLASVTLNTAHI